MQYVQTYCVECIDVHTYVLMYVFNVLYCTLCEFVNLSEVSVCCCSSIAHALCAALGGTSVSPCNVWFIQHNAILSMLVTDHDSGMLCLSMRCAICIISIFR